MSNQYITRKEFEELKAENEEIKSRLTKLEEENKIQAELLEEQGQRLSKVEEILKETCGLIVRRTTHIAHKAKYTLFKIFDFDKSFIPCVCSDQDEVAYYDD